jgi:hypothetical protein
MCCTTLTASGHEKHDTEFLLLFINWVVIADVSGNRRPQMHWHTDRAA